jgi:hypothetical protein
MDKVIRNGRAIINGGLLGPHFFSLIELFLCGVYIFTKIQTI